jgi:hypothetical protein
VASKNQLVRARQHREDLLPVPVVRQRHRRAECGRQAELAGAAREEPEQRRRAVVASMPGPRSGSGRLLRRLWRSADAARCPGAASGALNG